MPQNKLEFLDHTGDVGIRVNGNTLSSVFELAARGMFQIICPSSEIQVHQEIKFEITADNTEELLVNWLAELNYYCNVELVLFSEFYIDRVEPKHLVAIAKGEKIDPKRHHIHTEIKAVTYHGLYMKHKDGEWDTRIIFDI